MAGPNIGESINDLLKALHVEPVSTVPLDDQNTVGVPEAPNPRVAAFDFGLLIGETMRGWFYGIAGIQADSDDEEKEEA